MVDQAYALFKEGKLEKSREAIDMAAEHPSTVQDPKTWYLKSFIYKELSGTSKSDDIKKTSIASALKCISIDTAGRYTKDCRAILKFVYTSYLNDAVNALNQQEFSTVMSTLKPILESEDEAANPLRPQALFYTGYALLQSSKQQEARDFFFRALQLGFHDPLIYETEAMYRMNNSEWDSTRYYLDQGLQQFPQDANLLVSKLNFLMMGEQYEAAEETVKQYLDLYPENTEGLLLAGTIYEKLLPLSEDSNLYYEKQIQVYEKILNKNPDHLQANYNLGIVYYNRAVKTINQAAQNYDMDILAFNSLLNECSQLFMKALPYVEKVSKLDDTHVNALKALEGIYYNINDYEQYNLVKVKLEKL
ncbi:hypothetical protein PZB74_20910 [Porifericola rhodea]|uniref:tetratricopeptide repeat protein n=1 Tax=Porifericola rhodea TaxID=930972 RepID=UPI002665ACB8|nr:hypothetical protein [Porifericola rhodea]WKN31414.1 hypothetical protein PZB74_20910 [Porifericola rhodea]